jgi:hypothetical protein
LGLLKMLPAGWPPGKRVGFLGILIFVGGSLLLQVQYGEEVNAWAKSKLAPLTSGWGVIRARGIIEIGLILFVASATYVKTGSVVTLLGATMYLILGVVGAYVAKTGALSMAILNGGGAASVSVILGASPSVSVVAFLYLLTFTYSMLIALGGGVHVAGTIAVAGTGGVTVLSLLAEYFVGVGALGFGPLDVSYFIFLSALPVLNAVLDASSWAVSRWLGRKILERNFHQWEMIGFAVVDAALAIVLLCGLAILLGAGGEALDQLFITATRNPVLNLDAVIKQAATNPLGDGLWITLMLFSTLVPTAIHAFVAIGSVVQLRGRKEARAKWHGEADEALAENEGLDPHTCRKIAEHWLMNRWLPSVILLLVLLTAGWVAWQASVLPDALLAAVQWGRSLVG